MLFSPSFTSSLASGHVGSHSIGASGLVKRSSILVSFSRSALRYLSILMLAISLSSKPFFFSSFCLRSHCSMMVGISPPLFDELLAHHLPEVKPPPLSLHMGRACSLQLLGASYVELMVDGAHAPLSIQSGDWRTLSFSWSNLRWWTRWGCVSEA